MSHHQIGSLAQRVDERARLSAYQSGGSDAVQRLDKIASSGTVIPPWLIASSSSAVFLTIDGVQGEDGMILGLCRALDNPFVGCDILTSVICLDKAVCNSVLQIANLPQTLHLAIIPFDDPDLSLEHNPIPFHRSSNLQKAVAP